MPREYQMTIQVSEHVPVVVTADGLEQAIQAAAESLKIDHDKYYHLAGLAIANGPVTPHVVNTAVTAFSACMARLKTADRTPQLRRYDFLLVADAVTTHSITSKSLEAAVNLLVEHALADPSRRTR